MDRTSFSRLSPILFFFFTLALLVPAGAMADEAEAISDPLEGWNRGVFWFNDRFDRYIFEPVAEGYDYVVPDPVQKSVGNFFDNLRYPSYLVSDLVQLKGEQAGVHTARFLINTTLGIGGLFDVAESFGLEPHKEDFGTALAYHGAGPGPYLVLPFLGPSNLRDGFGLVVDSLLDPIPYIAEETMDSNDALAVVLGTKALNAVQTRANLLDAVDAARDASLDEYLFMQSAYYQHREALIHDKKQEKDGEADPFAEDEAFDKEFGDY